MSIEQQLQLIKWLTMKSKAGIRIQRNVMAVPGRESVISTLQSIRSVSRAIHRSMQDVETGGMTANPGSDPRGGGNLCSLRFHRTAGRCRVCSREME